MKYHKSRLMALFLAVCLIVSAFPCSALAAEQSGMAARLTESLTVVPTFPGGQYTQDSFRINTDSTIQYSLSFGITASTLDEPVLVIAIPKGLTLTYYPTAADPTLAGSLAAGTPVSKTTDGDGNTILTYRFKANVASIGFNINLRPTFLLPHDREVLVEASYYNGDTPVARQSSGVTCYNPMIADNYPYPSFNYNSDFYNNVFTDEYGAFISSMYVAYGPHYPYDAVRLVTAIPDGAVIGFGEKDAFAPLVAGKAYAVEDSNGGYTVTYLADYDFKDKDGSSLGTGQALVYDLDADNTYLSKTNGYYFLTANLFLRFDAPGTYNKGIGARLSVTVDGTERVKTHHTKTTSTSSTLKYTVKPYNLADFLYFRYYYMSSSYGSSSYVLPVEDNNYLYNTIYNKTGEVLTDVSVQYRVDSQFYASRISFNLYENHSYYPSRAEVRYKTAKGGGAVKRATLNAYDKVLVLEDKTDAITEFTVTYDKLGTNNNNDINLCQLYLVNRDGVDDSTARKLYVQVVAATSPTKGRFEDIWQEYSCSVYLASAYTGYLNRPSLSVTSLNKGDEFYVQVSNGSSMKVKNGTYYIVMPPEYIYVKHTINSNLPGEYAVTTRKLSDGNILYTVQNEDGVERNYENHYLYFRVGPTADTSVVRTETLPLGYYAEDNHPQFRLNTEDSNYSITDTLDYNQNGSTTDRLSKPYSLPSATINSVSTLFTQALLTTDVEDGSALTQSYRYNSNGTYRYYVFNGYESSVSPEDMTVTIAVPQQGDSFTYKDTVFPSKWSAKLTGAAVPEGDFWRGAVVTYSTDGGATYKASPSGWQAVTHVKVKSQAGRVLQQSESASIALPFTANFPEEIATNDKAYFSASTDYRLTGTVSKQETALTEPCTLQTATTDISGVVFKDYNANGIQDENEQNVGKAYSVQLYKGSAASGSVIASASSDSASGQYRVGVLLPDTYTAKVVKASNEFYNTRNTRFDAQGCYTFTIGDTASVRTGLNLGIISPRTMTLGYSSYNLKSDTPIKLSYTLSPTLLPGEEMKFASSDETVVTVSEDGTISYVADGTATITLTAPQLSSVVEQGGLDTISKTVSVKTQYAGCRITASPYIGKTASAPISGAITEQTVPYDPKGITTDFYYFYGRGGYCNNPAHKDGQAVKWEIADDGDTGAKLTASGNKVTLTAKDAGTVVLRAVEDWPHDADRKPAAKTVTLTITRQTVKKPVLNGACTYTGLPQKAAITSGDLYTIVGDMATDAGSYTATVALKAPQDYTWADGTDTPLTFDWSIAKATVKPPVAGPALVYTGAEQTAPIPESPLYFAVDNQATDAGGHTATVQLRDSGNYTWTDGTIDPVAVDWQITRAKVDKPTASGDFVYTGEEQTVPIPESNLYTISGNTASTAGSYVAQVTLNDPDNYEWADGSTDALTFDWKIGVVSVPMPAPDYALTYDGTEQSCGLEDAELYTVTGHTATNAGTHTATVTLRDSVNYQWSDGTTDPLTFEWEISAATVPQPSVDCDLTYNGAEQSCGLEDTELYTVEGGAATDAGDYTATVTLSDADNYTWVDGTTTPLTFDWNIGVASATKPTVDCDLTYDGTEQSCGLEDTEHYTVTGGAATNAGNYTATVTLCDSGNYQWEDGSTAPLTFEWEISAATVAMPTLDCDLTYNGTEQSCGLEDSELYSVTGGTAIDAGDYIATVTLCDADNYTWEDGSTDPLTFEWSIGVAGLPKPALDCDLTYNGIEQSCGLEDTELYTVTGHKATSAGDYTATVTLCDSENHQWEDGSTEPFDLPWHIAPKELAAGMVSCVESKVYSGQPITLEAVELTISDGDALTGADWEIDGYTDNVDVGTATVTVKASEGGNYTGAVQTQFAITPLPYAEDTFTVGAIPWQSYTGKEITPKPTVMWGETPLAEETDYTLSYENNIQTGTDTALVKIAFTGSFEGAATVPFTIYYRSSGGGGSSKPEKPVEPETPDSAGVPYYTENGVKVFIGFAAGGKYLAPKDADVQFAENPKAFTDISGHWGKEAIDFITQREVFVGTGKNTFSPDTGMTRAMFATVIGRLYEKSFGPLATEDAEPFSDVPAMSWYGGYVAWAAEQNLLVGVGGGKFAPERSITRAEMAVIFQRFAKLMDIADADMEAVSFSDSDLIPAWAAEAVAYCSGRGFMVGRGNSLFAPNATATRAEVSAILQRYITAIVA